MLGPSASASSLAWNQQVALKPDTVAGEAGLQGRAGGAARSVSGVGDWEWLNLNRRTQGVKRAAAAISAVALYAYRTGVFSLSKLDWPEHQKISPNSTLAIVFVVVSEDTVMFIAPTVEEVGGRVTDQRELPSEGCEVMFTPAKVTVTTEPVGAEPHRRLGVSRFKTMSSPNTVETREAGSGAGGPSVRQCPEAVSTTVFDAASTLQVREAGPQG